MRGADDPYDADYFLRGKESGKSLYSDYRWMPELTIPMCQTIAQHCGMKERDTVLDFGCARGYSVKALRSLGYWAYGMDTSEWAIENCDSDVRHFLTKEPQLAFHNVIVSYDWVIAKDVLEHVGFLGQTIAQLMDVAAKGVFVVVPLAKHDDQGYVIREYEKDITHIHRFTLGTWASKFMRPGWSVEARYRLAGVKDNYAQYPEGNGFITARRIG